MEVCNVTTPMPYVDVLFKNLDRRIFKHFEFFKRYDNGSWYYYMPYQDEFECSIKQSQLLEEAYQEYLRKGTKE